MSRTDESAAWAARIDAGPLDAPDQAAFDAWLAADVRNKGMLLRAQAMLSLVERAWEPGEPAQPAPAPVAAFRRRWWVGGGVAAAAALVGVVSTVALQPRHARFVTETGEVRHVAMEDGSRAIINTDTRMDAKMARAERLIVLDKGEAWFQVAKDHARPFIVSAGPVRARATGTAFAVRYGAEKVTVTITEGTVEVWNVNSAARHIPVHAGESVSIALEPEVPAVPKVVPASERALAWRDGDIVLDGMTLGQAVTEFNRYNLRKIRIGSPDIAAKPMIGYFKNNQPEQFAQAAASILQGRVVEDGNNIVIITTKNRNKKIIE